MTKPAIKLLFKEAQKMAKVVRLKKLSLILNRFCLVQLFYQPSTRTYTSFLAAAKWLGAKTIALPGMQAYSSATKGESLADTIKSINQTTAADLIILRHPDNSSAKIAAQASDVPVINAGAGIKEHPSQAILDLYSIQSELGRLANLKVVFLGDLKYGRTVKSLGKLLTLMDKDLELTLVSPKELKMPPALVKQWQEKGAKIHQTSHLALSLVKADVLYVTRIQKEWFVKKSQEKLCKRIKNTYQINLKILKMSSKKMIILHPLPRVNEIDKAVDSDARAAYFRQMRNGLYTRMALLKLILLKK